MLSIVTQEDLTKVENEFKKTIASLTERITELENYISVNSVKPVIRKAAPESRVFGSVEALESYVDDFILSAGIPNLDRDELDAFKSRATGYYIKDIIYRYAEKPDKQYLMRTPYSKGITRVDNWVQDPDFTRILSYCLPEYVSKYLTRRYKNIHLLTDSQIRARRAAEVYHQSKKSEADEIAETPELTIVGTCNQSQFKKRLDRAVRDFKLTSQYKEDFHSLGNLLRQCTLMFTKEELDECNKLYYNATGRYASRAADCIGYHPECAYRFIESFEKLVYSDN